VLHPDEVLYLATGAGEAFATLFARHRESVRRELEAAGLSPDQARSQVIVVFLRLMDSRIRVDRTRPLAQSLRDLARSVARQIQAGCGGEAAGSPAVCAAPRAICLGS
jgi:hypothetical protein